MAFFVGDIVRCVDHFIKQHSIAVGLIPGARHPKLSYDQRFEVSRVRNWHDGSQSLWVRYSPLSRSSSRPGFDGSERGPFSSVRFSLEKQVNNPMFQYDPTQQGDTEDDV